MDPSFPSLLPSSYSTHPLLPILLPHFDSLTQQLSSLSTDCSLLPQIFDFYLPYCLTLSQRTKKGKPYIQGILGVQGGGKSTFATICRILLGFLGHNTISISIDDFYLTYEERAILKQKKPMFKYRGPPGTHDVVLLKEVLTKIKMNNEATYLVPRFDKSLKGGEGDRANFEEYKNIDIVLFEGWFLGYRALDESEVENEGVEGEFAKEVNQNLKEYEGIWDLMDNLMVMIPEKIEYSKKWRAEAEEKMRREKGSGKSEEEINAFVDYFWLSLNPRVHFPNIIKNKLANDIYYMDEHHKITKSVHLLD